MHPFTHRLPLWGVLSNYVFLIPNLMQIAAHPIREYPLSKDWMQKIPWPRLRKVRLMPGPSGILHNQPLSLGLNVPESASRCIHNCFQVQVEITW